MPEACISYFVFDYVLNFILLWVDMGVARFSWEKVYFFADAFFVVEDLAELVFFFFTLDAESDLVDFFLEVVALRAIFCYPED